jgi:hypothetical protein
MEAKPKTERTLRERLHHLVEQLPGGELHAAERYLEFVHAQGDPVLRALMQAPEVEEQLSEEDEAALQEGRDALDRGEVVSGEEMRREFGW